MTFSQFKPKEIKFIDILIPKEMEFICKKMHLKMLFAKCQPYYPGLNVLMSSNGQWSAASAPCNVSRAHGKTPFTNMVQL